MAETHAISSVLSKAQFTDMAPPDVEADEPIRQDREDV